MKKIENLHIPLPPEDSKTYEQAIRKIRKSLARGETYEQACRSLDGMNEDLRVFITEDFLKILIAEDHFGTGIGIDDMALFLGLPYEKLAASLSNMVDEINEELAVNSRQPFSRWVH